MNVLILGSTGRTGRCLVKQALEQGHRVTAYARDPRRLPMAHGRLRVVRGDVLDPASVERATEGQEAVLSALGGKARGPRAVLAVGIPNTLRLMASHGVRRIVCVSAAGALREDAGSPVGNALLGLSRLALRNVFRDHAAQIRHLRESDRDWVAVRAVLLTNGARTGRYRVVLNGIPRGGYRISRADVAEFMLLQLSSDAYLHRLPAIAY
jgi:putative NADH-flavin reductase